MAEIKQLTFSMKPTIAKRSFRSVSRGEVLQLLTMMAGGAKAEVS